jgi:hypothetical protein
MVMSAEGSSSWCAIWERAAYYLVSVIKHVLCKMSYERGRSGRPCPQ